MPTTVNYTHATELVPDDGLFAGSGGTETTWTVAAGGTQTGTYSFTENDDLFTIASGGFGVYHNGNDLIDSTSISPALPGSTFGGFDIYDGQYDNGSGVTGIVVYDDASGNYWLFTDGDPGLSAADPVTTTLTSFCFLEGTLIMTPDGERPVEDLCIGDMVVTASGNHVPVKWLGVQRHRNTGFISQKYAPVRISAGALGQGLPHSDLCVTAEHGMIIDDLVVNAGALVNHDTITYAPMNEMPERFAYYHVETEAHEEILANGAAAETFIDYLDRRAFDNYQEYLDLYGNERLIPEMKRVRISSQRHLPEPIMRRLNITSFDLSGDLAALENGTGKKSNAA